MANFLSQRAEYNKVQDPVNLNLINTVLNAKQGKFDQGVAAIDNSLAELGNIDAKLLRPEDREHLSNNVKSLLETINSSGKLDLSNSGVTRNIQSQIKSALDSKVVNAVAQGTKMSAFQAAIAEKQKSKPELYSDVNYQYALKQAGVQDYMSGKTDTIGNLNYDDYVNAPKVLDESISKWAKDYGYHTEFVEGDKNQLIYTNEEKKILTKNEIINKLKTSLDPKLSKQLQIDSDYHYSTQPEGQINTDATNYYTKQNAQIDQKLLEIKAARTGQTATRKIELDNNENYYKGLKEDNTKVLSDKNFDNIQQKYQIYTTSLFDGIAENYDKNETVEIKYVDNNLKIAQFNADIEYKKATLDQGQQRIDIAKQTASATDLANTIASGGTLGSVTDIADPTAGTKTDSQIANERHNNDHEELKAALAGSSKEYNELKTPAEKEQFIKNLATSNNSVSINNDTLSPEVREKLDIYKSSLGTIMKVRQSIVTTVGNTLVGKYNDMIGSSTNFANLAKTAPLTAKYAKAGIPLDKLTKQQAAEVKHEMAVNTLNFDDGLSAEERTTLTTYAVNLEQQPYLSPAQKKGMREKDKKEIGFGEGGWDILKNDASYVGNGVAWGRQSVMNLFDNNPNSQKKTNDSYFKTRDNLDKNNIKIRDRIDKRSLDVGFGNEDSNLTELEAGDLRGGAKSGVRDAIRGSITAATNLATIEYKKVAETAKNYRGLSFNPEDKKQAPYTTAIQTQLAAISGTPVVFEKGSVVSTVLSKDGSSIDVTYTLKDTTEKVTTSIAAGSIPKLSNSLTDKSVPFINSKLNKNAPARRTTYEVPVDSKAREDLLYKLHSTYGEGIFPEKAMLAQLGKGSSVPTQVELRAYGEGQPPEVIAQINEISTEPYDVVWMPAQIGTGWVGVVKDSKNNTITEGDRIDKDYNEGGMRSAAIDAVNQAKLHKIFSLIKK